MHETTDVQKTIHDVHSKEQWLRIIENEKPTGAYEHFAMLAARYATIEQLNILEKSFPNLIDAELEHREKLRE